VEPDSRLSLWDVPSGKRQAVLTGEKKQTSFWNFSPSGEFLAWGWGNTLRIRDCKQGKELHQISLERTLLDVAFDRDNRSLLVCVEGLHSLIFDARTGRQAGEVPAPADSVGTWPPYTSPSGRLMMPFVEGNSGRRHVIREALTGRVVYEGDETEPWASSPDERILAIGSTTVRLIETATGRQIACLREGHRGWTSCVAFSPDGRRLATGGSDGNVVVWDCDTVCGLSEKLLNRNLQQLWADLASDDPSAAYRSAASMLAQPVAAVRTLKENLEPVTERDLELLRGRIKDLEDRRFAVRRRVYQELQNTPPEWLFVLRESLWANPSLEQRRRLESLLESPSLARYSAETVRALRAVFVLERIGTPEARSLLAKLAGGLPSARLTQDAADALKRLNSAKGR
jgi:hypothetical protein